MMPRTSSSAVNPALACSDYVCPLAVGFMGCVTAQQEVD